MPTTCALKAGSYRVVEDDGEITTNEEGTAVDGGGPELANVRFQTRTVGRDVWTQMRRGDHLIGFDASRVA